MVRQIDAIDRARRRNPLSPLVRSRVFEVVGPFRMRERWEAIGELPEDCVLLETRLTGVCHADLRYVSCSRPPEVLRERLPLSVFHEGVAEIAAVGENVRNLSVGDLVVIVPNIPCYIHNPDSYPDVYRACESCRPGGAGENLCRDVRFLSSNAPGLSRTFFVHPASCVFLVPEGVPEEIAALTEPLTVINRAVRQAKVNFDDRAAVLGGGFMGFITAAVLSKIVGVSKPDLLVTDILDSKLDRFTDFATTTNVRKEPLSVEPLSSFDVAFECAGGRAAESTVDQALSLLSPGGTCMLIGVSEEPVPISTRPVLEKGLTLRGTTRSAAIDYPDVLRWLEREDLRELLSTMISPRTFAAKDCESLISACKTAESAETHGKVLIDWR